MRTLLVVIALAIFTPYYFAIIIGAKLLGVRHRDGGFYSRAARGWSSKIARAAGIRVHKHGFERIAGIAPRVLVANHVSWFDVFALASELPHFAFVAKAELRRIPFFGVAAAATGQVFIQRTNRKAAFAAYETAAERIKEGATVVIFPEGTRGHDYTLRPFKKGPFVLAIAAGAPIFPVIIHGAIHVHPRGSRRVRAGDIHIHVLDPISTTGLTYDDRDALAAQVHASMRDALHTLYGVTPAAPTLAPTHHT